MGSSLGQLLAEASFRVVTTVEGRSGRTHRLCREAGLEALPSLADVVRTADVVLSLVPPATALAAARDFAEAARHAATRPVYVDANSISPLTVDQVAEVMAAAEIPFVDGAIHGLASQLRTRGTLYLSGPAAAHLAAVFGGSMRTRSMGETPGKASAYKGLLAGINKGLVALFLEMCALAHEADLLEELFAGCRSSYPGVMEVIERLLPSYPQHAGRRAQEMQELERTMLSSGLKPCVIRGSRQVIQAVARMDWENQESPQPAAAIPVIQAILRQSFLRD
jgi:3-hydroxyisobutyrate dehydrogenase-like beta-hydroxyacid dehydrogenase